MIKTLKDLGQRGDDRGVALPFVAIMLVLLIGMTAFAVDLGWLYLNGSRVQRGADAAALAGVVHLPANTAQVTAQSVNGANANGWDIGMVNGNPIAGGGPDSLTWQPLSENRLQVEVSANVPTFFLRVFGIDDLTMTRRATAEYIKPVPMGSPSACFGIGAFATASLSAAGLSHCSAFAMNFWAAINGPYTAKEHGDPYAVQCLTAPSGSCGAANPDYRPSGYYYGIEIPAGKTAFDVKIFDAAFYHRGCQVETGDCHGLSLSTNGGMTTHYTLYQPDATPLDPTDNSVQACPTRSYATNHSSPATTRNVWTTICTVNAPSEGIYVLNVRSTGNTGGNNSYSVGVTTNPSSGPHSRVYAINDMSIFTNAASGVATVYLAEVDQSHANKTLQLGFYDPGENTQVNNNAWVEVRMPNNTTPSCAWVAHIEAGAQTGSGSGACRIQSTIAGTPNTYVFNAQWLDATITIPSNYSCTSDCFWTMRLDMANSQDRTTWTARVIGNPVRLVPNEP